MQFENVTCTQCGLLCDDLTVEVNDLSIKVTGSTTLPVNCIQKFEAASLQKESMPSPMINGASANIGDAIDEAAKIIKSSMLTLVSGLITDVQTQRDAIAFTEKIKGVIDHANGKSIRASNSVMQRHGEIKTTLAEIRNRSDVVVIFGKQVFDKFPRLTERVLKPEKTLNNELANNKNIIVLDLAKNNTASLEEDINLIQFNYPRLESIIYRFQEIITKGSSNFPEPDHDTEQLLKIVDSIQNSQYTTMLWSTSLFNSESAEHSVQALTELLKLLSKELRCVGLSLSGSKAEITANQVTTWQTGVSLPVTFTTQTPVYDPVLYDGNRLIQNHDVDSLLWIANLGAKDTAPETKIPTIVLGHPNLNSKSANIFIPVAIPGIDTNGLASRTDSVATLPLRQIRNSDLPTASDVLNKIKELV